jgi:hypothetical protein
LHSVAGSTRRPSIAYASSNRRCDAVGNACSHRRQSSPAPGGLALVPAISRASLRADDEESNG